jgi:hypothetical protein
VGGIQNEKRLGDGHAKNFLHSSRPHKNKESGKAEKLKKPISLGWGRGWMKVVCSRPSARGLIIWDLFCAVSGADQNYSAS